MVTPSGESPASPPSRPPPPKQETDVSRDSTVESLELPPDLDALQLVCPITAELFEDPVILVEDGYTYERSAVTT